MQTAELFLFGVQKDEFCREETAGGKGASEGLPEVVPPGEGEAALGARPIVPTYTLGAVVEFHGAG
jgi:hypothetical protein